MKKFKVEVSELREVESATEKASYPSYDTIYEQTLDTIDLTAIIVAVNKLVSK